MAAAVAVARAAVAVDTSVVVANQEERDNTFSLNSYIYTQSIAKEKSQAVTVWDFFV